MSFSAGETVGSYRIIEQLGQGGMATVYKAYHAALDRYVAIKVLHPAFLEDPNFLARFQREARLIAKLEHPNIVPIYDFAEYEGRPYLVMKYIQGKTLKAVMSEHPLTKGEILHVVDAVGAGLEYAHKQGVLHRDIKPSNVILEDDGDIFLADFGLARIASGSSSTLTSDMMVGTPQYISPEQAMSKPDLDGRTDIYSFGVMIYEMVVGRVPFSADTPFAVIHDHIYTPLPLPRDINPDVPEEVQRVLLKALAKAPEDRYSTVEALVSAMHLAMDDSPWSGRAGADELPLWEKTQPTVHLEDPEERVLSVVDSIPSQMAQPDEAQLPEESALPEEAQLPQESQGVIAGGEAAPIKKKRSKLWYIAGGALIFLLLAAVATLLAMKVTRDQANAAATQEAASLTTEEVADRTEEAAAYGAELSGIAWEALDNAREAWLKGDVASAVKYLDYVRNETENNPLQASHAIRTLEDSQNWILAARLGALIYEAHPAYETPTRLLHLHMALYYAAQDKRAEEILKDLKDNPLYSIARLRYALYYGSDFQDAKDKLQSALNSSAVASRFPEIYLLDAEFSLKEGDRQSALNRIHWIEGRPEFPVWVIDAAYQLEEAIPK